MDDDVREAVAALRKGARTVGEDAALMLIEDELAELDAARATMQGLHDQLIGGGPYPTFDEIARTLGAALDAVPAADTTRGGEADGRRLYELMCQHYDERGPIYGAWEDWPDEHAAWIGIAAQVMSR